MNIGIDVSMITPTKAGIGYYVYSIVKALTDIDSENHYYLYTNDSSLLSDINLPQNFEIVEIGAERANLSWMFKVYLDFKKRGVSVFISPSNLLFGCLFPKTITVIHDLAQIKYPQFFNKKGRIIFKIMLDIILRREKVIVTSSNTVRDEIIEYYKGAQNKTYAIGEGVHEWTKKQLSNGELRMTSEKYSLPEKYFLSVNTLEPRKNYINSIKGFAEFCKTDDSYKYLIVGKKGWFYEQIFEEVKRLGLEDKVIFLGYVPEEDITAIYDLSSGLVYLSVYEGFGLQLIEAYSRGIPSLVSDIPVFHEVIEDKSIFVNPNSIEDITKGYKILSKIPKFTPDQFFLDKYSWKSPAAKLLELVKNLP